MRWVGRCDDWGNDEEIDESLTGVWLSLAGLGWVEPSSKGLTFVLVL